MVMFETQLFYFVIVGFVVLSLCLVLSTTFILFKS